MDTSFVTGVYLDIITVAAFAAVSFMVFWIVFTLFGRQRRRELERHAASEQVDFQPVEPSRFAGAMASALPLLPGELDGLKEDLLHAGHYRSTALVEYLSTRNTLILSLIVSCLVLAVAADPGSNMPEVFLIVGLVTGFICHMLPRILLRRQAVRRVERVERGLPDALDITSMCLAGGLSLRDSLQRCSKELRWSQPDLAVEFDIIRRHAEASSMSKALRRFADRISSTDIKSFAALINQSERIGAQVSTAVADFAESLRLNRRQRAEERAGKASVKLLFPIILCLAPPIYILLAGPPLLRIKDFLTTESVEGGVLDVGVDDIPAPPTP